MGRICDLSHRGARATFAWAQGAGSPVNDNAAALAILGDNVFLVGNFYGTAVFGTSSINSVARPNFLDTDIFLARLVDDVSPRFEWAQSTSGSGPDFATSVVTHLPEVYVGGGFAGPASFSSVTLAGPAFGRADFLAGLELIALGTPSPDAAHLDLTVTPNPAHGTATVRVAEPGAFSFVLLDALGRTVRRSEVQPAVRERELVVDGLPTGLYMPWVQVGARSATRRLLVE